MTSWHDLFDGSEIDQIDYLDPRIRLHPASRSRRRAAKTSGSKLRAESDVLGNRGHAEPG